MDYSSHSVKNRLKGGHTGGWKNCQEATIVILKNKNEVPSEDEDGEKERSEQTQEKLVQIQQSFRWIQRAL